MTSVTVDLVLREWRKLALLHYGDRVRHKDGTFATILGRANQGDYDFRVKYDDDDEPSMTYRHNLFPPWWPEEQWPRLLQVFSEPRKLV
jgi:hypothetical protein